MNKDQDKLSNLRKGECDNCGHWFNNQLEVCPNCKEPNPEVYDRRSYNGSLPSKRKVED